VDTYQETYRFNETIPIRPLPEYWTPTVRSSFVVAPFFLGAALYAMTNFHRFLDVSAEGAVYHEPRRDAGALSDLYSFDALPDLDALAAAQGVRPIENIDDLVADFWPEDESVEDFIAAAMEGRHEEDEPDS
jgi:hypothetical protein